MKTVAFCCAGDPLFPRRLRTAWAITDHVFVADTDGARAARHGTNTIPPSPAQLRDFSWLSGLIRLALEVTEPGDRIYALGFEAAPWCECLCVVGRDVITVPPRASERSVLLRLETQYRQATLFPTPD